MLCNFSCPTDELLVPGFGQVGYIEDCKHLHFCRDHFGPRHCAMVTLKTEMVHANSLSAPKWRRKLTYGPWNLRIVRPWSGSFTQI
jgi:hypothetical protein